MQHVKSHVNILIWHDDIFMVYVMLHGDIKSHILIMLLFLVAVVTWLNYCRYGVKLYPTNQTINYLVSRGRSISPYKLQNISLIIYL